MSRMGSAWIALVLMGASLVHGERSPDSRVEAVRGSRLSLQVEVSGGRLRVEAGRFYELFGTDEVTGGERLFIPGTVLVRAEGNQAGEYVLLPFGEGKGWHERTRVNLDLDQTTVWEMSRETIEKGDREVWSRAPLRVEVHPGKDGEALLYLRANSPALGATDGGKLRHEINSIFTEEIQRFPLQEGERRGGEVRSRSEPREIPLQIQIGGAVRDVARWHSNLYPPPLTMELGEGLPVEMESRDRLRSIGEKEEISMALPVPGSEGGFGGTTVRFAWEFRLGAPPDVGWWEAVEKDGETWLPAFETERRFRVHLTSPEKVEQVRFVLSDCSQYPGVAVNALHDHLLDRAIHRPGEGEETVTLGQGETTLSWTRNYPVVVSGPKDEFADLCFTEVGNPSALVEGEVIPSANAGLLGGELRFEEVTEEMTAVVRVCDWAASGRVSAQVLVDGLWEDLQARGDGVEPEGFGIRFPRDENSDGIPDAFAEASEGDEDGDGLSLLEEYRGVVVGGKHVRLDPAVRDVFVIDYKQVMGPEMKEGLHRRLKPRGVQIHWLGLGEHRTERVGETVKALVLEPLQVNALPRILKEEEPAIQVLAWQAIRPRPGARAVFVDEGTDCRWLAEDLLRVLDVPEFGAQEERQ